MPRYVLGSRALSRSARESASDLAASRFPEVTVDLRFAAHDDDGLDVWICQAPSEIHLRRWASDAELAIDLLQPVDHDGHPLRGSPTITDTSEGEPRCDH